MNKFMFFCTTLLLSSVVNAQLFDFSSLIQEELLDEQISDIDDNNTFTEAFNEIDTNNNKQLEEYELLKYQKSGIEQGKDATHKILDSDNDGNVSKEEFIRFYKKRAGKNTSITDLNRTFSDADTDKNNNLSKDELNDYRHKNLEIQNHEIFGLMDTNQDGVISEDEFDYFMNIAEGVLGNTQMF